LRSNQTFLAIQGVIRWRECHAVAGTFQEADNGPSRRNHAIPLPHVRGGKHVPPRRALAEMDDHYVNLSDGAHMSRNSGLLNMALTGTKN
jgi:hypothetical protein